MRYITSDSVFTSSSVNRLVKGKPKAQVLQSTRQEIRSHMPSPPSHLIEKRDGFTNCAVSKNLYKRCHSASKRPSPATRWRGVLFNASAKGTGRTEYIWLPTDDGSVAPVSLS